MSGRYVVAIFCLILIAVPSMAQRYTITGSLSKPINASVYLTVFDGDTTYHNQRFRTWDKFRFTGSVKEPVLAAISSKNLPQPIYFFIENSNITIHIDVDNPNASSIVGSRINSQYRYAMEPCTGENTEACMVDFVQSNPTSIFSTFLLSERLGTLPYSEQIELFNSLQGPAKTAYHYHTLAKRLNKIKTVDEGSAMPNIAYVDTSGTMLHFDSVKSTNTYNIVLYATTWCESCQKAISQLKNGTLHAASQIIYIDKQPEQWDAPCVQSLSVDHIPYIILTDKKGIIVARDLRIWEIHRYLK